MYSIDRIGLLLFWKIYLCWWWPEMFSEYVNVRIGRHSLPGSGSGKQNIRHSQKIYIFWKLFTYRIIIAIHNGASWVLPISDFFKLLYSKKGKFSLFFFISKLIEK